MVNGGRVSREPNDNRSSRTTLNDYSPFTIHHLLTSHRRRGGGRLDQDFSVYEVNDTGAAQGVQAHGHALARGADDGGDLAVRQGQVNEDAALLLAPVALGEFGQELVEARGDGVQGEVDDAALGAREALTNHAESVIIKLAARGHPLPVNPRRNSQQSHVLVGDGALLAHARRVERRLPEERAAADDVHDGLAARRLLDGADFDAAAVD